MCLSLCKYSDAEMYLQRFRVHPSRVGFVKVSYICIMLCVCIGLTEFFGVCL